MNTEPTSHPGLPKKAPEATQAPKGLAGRSFTHLFRSDRTPERVEFQVGGRPAWVELLPMGKDARDGFISRSGGSAGAAVQNIQDLHAYLVGHTLTGYLLWRRATLVDGTPGDWQELRPPEGAKNLYDEMREGFDCAPEFWDALTQECYRINGLSEDEKGNSPRPSPN